MSDRHLQAVERRGRLGDVIPVFQDWLYLPDPGIVYAVLGAVAANRLDGDPVWLQVIAPPGFGKTEVLLSIADLDDVHLASTITEAALLSGTPKKEKAEGRDGRAPAPDRRLGDSAAQRLHLDPLDAPGDAGRGDRGAPRDL